MLTSAGIQVRATVAGLIDGNLIVESEVNEQGEYTGAATLILPDGSRFRVVGLVAEPNYRKTIYSERAGRDVIVPQEPHVALTLTLAFSQEAIGRAVIEGAVPVKAVADLREELAALAHEQWSGWMEYLFGKCEPADPEMARQGIQSGRMIPAWAVERWARQMTTPYHLLSDEEKESDRKEADRVLALLGQIGEV